MCDSTAVSWLSSIGHGRFISLAWVVFFESRWGVIYHTQSVLRYYAEETLSETIMYFLGVV